MFHVAQLLALVYNTSVMCTAPGHKDITPEQVTLGKPRSSQYRVTYRDLVLCNALLQVKPELALISCGQVSLGTADPLVELVANWYADQIGLL